ncbi:MAG: hypothetical protein R2758_05930 [Bacteroidales bacterium]
MLLLAPLAGNRWHKPGQDNDTVRYNEYGVAVKRTMLSGREKNVVYWSSSRKIRQARVWTDIRVQADGAVFFGDTYNLIGNGTSIRRARGV